MLLYLKNNKIIKSLILAIILVSAVFVFDKNPNTIIAQTSNQKLSGYAWSDNIGWIHFATSTGSQNVVEIGTEGYLNGYAWSDNIGWIKFGDLSGFPSSGTNARLAGVNLNGWARACAGTVNGDCNSATRTDGWDGWIALSDPSGNEVYGVQFNNPQGSNPSFAWGSDVIGWIDFSGVTNQSSIINGQCRTYPAGSPQLPTLPGDGDLCISGTLDELIETRITAFNPTVNNPYDYSYTWNCLGNNQLENNDDDLNCSVTTDIQRSYDESGSVHINARLNPSIVNSGQKCYAGIVENVSVINSIVASSTCEVYKESDLNTAIDSAKNPASLNQADWPGVDPGYDYKIICKDNNDQTQTTHFSKTLKCLLNPKIKEI